ncbi:DMT family transporter [Saccharococcus caldoxylosilyticus]|uniref:Putative transporter n=1 Tax=Parageobacillus caldoxylosilyticus NBRC 107762 TaxID=1220594 RepID=A0A023DFD2_9BACL|nr:DMT family transporter [Parageobacillus caldoxylosilyticus]MBB3851488.1 drug/metabolite transporter (DMT)-like permease [Parageobacillus caldoxylosilyticus]GAJ40004.1 putative transporter [Parageobacillus caldoxylosilyticus NBRC 107762]
MKNTFFGAFYLSLAASIWGGMYVVSKYVLDFVPPFTLVWLRYAIAFVVLFGILKVHQYKTKARLSLRKQDWLLLGWIGFIGYFVSISLQFVGTKLSDAHTGALITSATPAFIVLFARLVLHEWITLRKAFALLLATIGVVIVIGLDNSGGTSFWGNMMLVGAALTWALLSVYVKVASTRFSALTITTYAILFALLFTTPVMIWELYEQPVSFPSMIVVFGVLYLGIISTAGAFFLWNKGMEMMDAGIGSLFFFFQPLVGAVFGFLFLHEQIAASFYVGGLLIIIGVFIAVKHPIHQHQSKEGENYGHTSL